MCIPHLSYIGCGGWIFWFTKSSGRQAVVLAGLFFMLETIIATVILGTISGFTRQNAGRLRSRLQFAAGSDYAGCVLRKVGGQSKKTTAVIRTVARTILIIACFYLLANI